MGAWKCEFGITHKVCRCPKAHTMKCDKPEEHKDANCVPKHRRDVETVVGR